MENINTEKVKLCCRCHKKPRVLHNPYCEECRIEYYKDYYQKHKHWLKRYQYINKQRRKARIQRRKAQLVEAKGGKCQICGYSKNLSALIFHHATGRKGKIQNKRRNGLIAEENPQSGKFDINKVTLVCANCHAELHHPA